MKETTKPLPGLSTKSLYGKLLLMATGIGRRFACLARGPGPCEIGPHGLAPARLGLGRRNKNWPIVRWFRDHTGVDSPLSVPTYPIRLGQSSH